MTYDKKIRYVLLAPALILLFITVLYPLIDSFWISMHDWNLKDSVELGKFIWFDNYLRALQDPVFWKSIQATFIFAGLSIVSTIVFGLGIALLLSREKKHLEYIRSILIIPFAVSPAVVGYSWRFMFNSEYGLFVAIIGFVFPFLKDVLWLGSPAYAMITLVSCVLWVWLPFICLIFISGLMSLPVEVYEASKIDGASAPQAFFKITIPLLSPILLIGTIMVTMFALKTFDPIVILTQGGPGVSTNVLNYEIYKTAFRFFELGYASALAYILVAIIMIFAAFYMRLLIKGDGWR